MSLFFTLAFLLFAVAESARTVVKRSGCFQQRGAAPAGGGKRARCSLAFPRWAVGVGWHAWRVLGRSQAGRPDARTPPAWDVASGRTGWSTGAGELWPGAGRRLVCVLPRVVRPSCSWGFRVESMDVGGGGQRTPVPQHAHTHTHTHTTLTHTPPHPPHAHTCTHTPPPHPPHTPQTPHTHTHTMHTGGNILDKPPHPKKGGRRLNGISGKKASLRNRGLTSKSRSGSQQLCHME